MNFYRKNEIIEEEKKIIGIEPVIDMKNFALLLLVDLARKTPLHNFNNLDEKIAKLPFEYRDIIEKIMYEENGWSNEFASIIPIYSYYECQREWEIKLGKTIQEVLKENNLKHDYDLEYNCLNVYFTDEFINKIRSECDDMLLEVMDHFSNLIISYPFSRKARLEDKESERIMNRLYYETKKGNKKCYRSGI